MDSISKGNKRMKVFDEYMLIFSEAEIEKARIRWLKESKIHKSLRGNKNGNLARTDI